MQPTNQGLSLEEWKEARQKYGRQYAIMQDMIQLGFLTLSPTELETLKEGMARQQQLGREIGKITRELNDLPNVESILKKIRAARIERVRQERAIRKAQRAVEAANQKKAQKQRRRTTPFYLGEGVSAGLKFEGTDYARLNLQKLPIIDNASQLAAAIGISDGQISWLCYHRKASTIDHYQRFRIPKKSGGYRLISSPKPLLRKAQEWILDTILEKIPVHDAAMAFRAKRSIVDNAELHHGNQTIIRLDMKDFFPSIKFRRVKGLFRCFGYNEGVATLLALLCTDSARLEAKLDDKTYHVALGERYLPQGACTSPALTNIICKRLDARMAGLCKKLDFIYSRYADDIVLSNSDPKKDVKQILKWTKEIVEDESFVLHPDKLNVMRPHQRQTVTGVVVNERIGISRRDLRLFRSFLHHYEQEGQAAMSARIGKDALEYAKGYWSFIQMVNQEQAAKLANRHPWLKEKD